MDLTTVIGILSGFALVVAAIFTGGGLHSFFDLPSIMITIGGTLASTLANYPLPRIIGILGVVSKAFFNELPEHNEIVRTFVNFAEKARRDGLLSLEEEVDALPDTFIRQGIYLIIDGVNADTIRNILNNEIVFLRERHKTGQGIFTTMAQYAPAFGMIGTLIGLIQMLRNLNDPASIGPGMATALITTFYGAIMANLIFLPIAGKLKTRSREEVVLKELTIEGIMSLQAGDSPRIIDMKLKAFIEPRIRETYKRTEKSE